MYLTIRGTNPSVRIYHPAFDVKRHYKQTPQFCIGIRKVSKHFVPQVGQTLSFDTKFLPFKGATEPNSPARNATLFWTLLPQLFVQFEAQLDADPLSLLNAQSEDKKNPPSPNSYRTPDTAIHPFPDF